MRQGNVRKRAPSASLSPHMRRPIRIQLLVPALAVVLLAILLASGTSAALDARWARQQQEESLHRVAHTLATAGFPLTESVLKQANRLSGAEFIFLDGQDRIQSSTLRQVDAQSLSLTHIDETRRFSPASRVNLHGQVCLGDRVAVPQRGATAAGWLVALYPEERWSAVTRQATYPALISGGLSSIVVILITAVLAQRFVRPIQRLGNQTAAIASGQFEPLAVPERDDEIRDLAVSINHMAQQLHDYEHQARRSERLRTLGQLGAALAHQLRNSATGARMAIELHGLSCSEGADCETIQVALRQLSLMESYLQRFLTLGRSRPEVRGPVDLGLLAAEVLELVRPMASHTGVALDLQPGAGPVTLEGDREGLRQLLANLIINALEAASRETSPQPRGVVVRVEAHADRVVLGVGDTGPGPAEETRQHMFEPFITEKPEGTGLGLFVVREVAVAHGGAVGYCRRDNQTWFEVEFPRLTRKSDDGAPVDCG
jgi:signal transduction histidine kinase